MYKYIQYATMSITYANATVYPHPLSHGYAQVIRQQCFMLVRTACVYADVR